MTLRLWLPEDRPCWWCRVMFRAKRRDEVLCSKECGWRWHTMKRAS